MNLIELNHALRQLRLGGMAAVLETRLQQAQAEAMAPIDLISCLVADELTRRGDRLLELQVADDGRGFEYDRPPASGHLGLRVMRQRAEQAGGNLQVCSSPGAGTRVTVRVPVDP